MTTSGFGVLTTEDHRAETDAATKTHLDSLYPPVAVRARALLAWAWQARPPLCITAGSTPEDKGSLQAWGLGFEVAMIDGQGQPATPDDDALWRRIGEIGEDLDLQWGGRFRSPRPRYFQMSYGLRADLLASGDQVLPPLELEETSCHTPTAGPTGAAPSTGGPGIPETARSSPSAIRPSGSPGPATSERRTGKSS